MFKSGWTVVGLGVLFVIIQSCGDELGTGRIMTPGATPEMSVESNEPQQPLSSGPMTEPEPEPVGTEDGGWPDYEYDDGGTYWDGGAPIELNGWHWNQGVQQYRGQNGQRYLMHCIPMGTEFAVWGSNPYTDDSPVCMAGQHQGVVNRFTGGDVLIEIRPAQKSYRGGDAKGVTAFPWGPFPGSYVVIH